MVLFSYGGRTVTPPTLRSRSQGIPIPIWELRRRGRYCVRTPTVSIPELIQLRNGKSIKSVDPMLEHMLVSGMFSAFFELLIHKDDIKEAKTYLKQLRAFYTAGWAKVFEMSLEG